MNLRNIDGTQVTYKEGSHKKIIFDCDVCGTSIEQSYRNYNKQQNGKSPQRGSSIAKEW